MITPLLAAMVIATAFWGGVLLARRLRDWGDGRPMLEEGSRVAALPATPDAGSEGQKRIRARVAERIHAELAADGLSSSAPRQGDELSVDRVRTGDVVTIEAGLSEHDGDYLVEGFVRLHEGGNVRIVCSLTDAGRRRWLVASLADQRWFLVQPTADLALRDEPPRTIRHHGTSYSLDQRAQHTAGASGRHGRPSGTRVATYSYRGAGDNVLWVERWGHEVLVGEGVTVARHDVVLLPAT
ncbi:MAG: DUF4178 domain-containing protein [Myxococcales bacterium FL481]|nr:MAG: DUF4178 domain-containing protein [Myxococcales bacterium FL481]